MKNILWILLIAFLFTNCGNETNNTGSQESQENQPTTSQSETPSEPGHYTASPDAPYVGLWVIQFALGSGAESKEELAAEFEGRWFNLKRDNTFTSGKWQESNNAGKWSYDASTKFILLEFQQPDGFNPQWRIQGQGDRMVWLGNTPSNQKGTQLKLIRETVLPHQPQ